MTMELLHRHIQSRHSIIAATLAILLAATHGFAFASQVNLIDPAIYLKASNTDPEDEFGGQIAISGNTVVVSAITEDGSVGGDGSDNDLASSGTAYVFELDDGEWIQTAYLKGSNTDGSDQFGARVAISGDTIAVSAIFEDSASAGTPNDNSANAAGAVYIFRRAVSGEWIEEALLKASTIDAGDRFGRALALSDNLLVVGAQFEDSSATGINGNETDNSAPSAGAAYVFERSAEGDWTQQAYLKASNTEENDQFGVSVAISGETIIVGAQFEDSNGDEADNSMPNAGAAYVFSRDGGGSWVQQAYLKASNVGPQDWFGSAVAIDSDTALIGAYFENSGSTGGAAYVFVRDESDLWLEQAVLKASNTQLGDQFGGSVALAGDRVLVGARFEDSGTGDPSDNSVQDSGAGYLFERDSKGIWTEIAYLKSPSPDPEDQFGRSVAMTDSLFVLGVPEEDSAATGLNGDTSNNDAEGAGAAFMFIEVQDAVFSSRFEM